MGETIQAFVEKIRNEGIQAGQQQADDLHARAQQEATQIIADARGQAETILAEAKAEAQSTLDRSQTELKLAARDAALRLRDALTAALREVLARGARTHLADEAFVGQVLHEIVTQFAKMDLEGKPTFRINVPEDMRDKLVDWAMAHIGKETVGPQGEHITIDLKGTLSQAGFEYNATGATVEVTLDSVVAVLADMVSPALRDLLEKAMAEAKDNG